MTRLPDEQWAMIEDSIDKKRTAASAFKQRTHCGKGGRVRFPSDFKSKKELKAMNGEVKSYRLNSAMSWDEFKSMPDDLKVAYINGIRERFSAPDKYVAEMFGISQGQFGLYIKDLKLDVELEKGEWNKEAFLAWVSGADPSMVKEVEPEEVETVTYQWKPMKWDTFKTAPDERKIDYIQWIRETFKAPSAAIAESMDVAPCTLTKEITRLGIGLGRSSANGKGKWPKDEFRVWYSGEASVKVEEQSVVEDLKAGYVENVEDEHALKPIESVLTISEPTEVETETPHTDKTEATEGSTAEKVRAIPTFGELNFDCSADQALNTLAMLLGTKHVQLNVRWDVVEG